MTNIITNKAIRSIVPCGSNCIEGFVLPTQLWGISKFAVSKTQAVLLAYPDYDASQAAKRYIEIVSSKTAKTIIQPGLLVHRKVSIYSENQKVDLLSLADLPTWLKVCMKLGSESATEKLIELAGLSLEQLFSDHFKIKFDEEDRQNWLVIRQQVKVTRRLLTDAIKDYCDKHPERSDNYRKFIYNNCTDKLYRALFRKPATKLREELQCVGDLRAFFTDTELIALERHEDYATRLIDKLDIEPQEAIANAIEFYS
jgi:hypothetical protein